MDWCWFIHIYFLKNKMIQRVRTNLIETGAVTGNKLGANSVAGNTISASSVTSNAIANGAITNAKLAEPNAFEDMFLMGGL